MCRTVLIKLTSVCCAVSHPGSMTSRNEVVITMTAAPEAYKDGTGILSWYRDTHYLQDFLDEYAEGGNGTMTFHKESGRYEIRFLPNEFFPTDRKKQIPVAIQYLEDPDDDGNYPMDGVLVQGRIRSIDGVEFYEWKEKKLVRKEEYSDVL
jgi:hypothetical protein